MERGTQKDRGTKTYKLDHRRRRVLVYCRSFDRERQLLLNIFGMYGINLQVVNTSWEEKIGPLSQKN